MTWREQASSKIVATNNIAVSYIQEGRYAEAQALLILALVELHKQTQDSPIMMNPPSFLSPALHTPASSIAATPDDWLVPPPLHDDIDDSFFVYKEGIPISKPPPSASNANETAAHYKSMAFVIFFNHGLACHLSYNDSSGMSTSHRNQMAASAHELYRLALQYRHEENFSTGKFLLAVCNNLAVLDRQWNPRYSVDKNEQSKRVAGPYFEYLQLLLGNHDSSTFFTKDELALMNRCWNNVLLVQGCHLDPTSSDYAV
eukprot:scaffold25117_cov117-Cylindrotheca_fusiformis.AAC.3